MKSMVKMTDGGHSMVCAGKREQICIIRDKNWGMVGGDAGGWKGR